MPDWVDPVDLRVYRFGGLIAAHVAPWYNPHRVSPLYDWPGHLNLKFTYPPFAALLFTALTIPALPVLVKAWVAVNVLALVAAIWCTLGALPQFALPQSALPQPRPDRPAPDRPAPVRPAPGRAGRHRAGRTGGRHAAARRGAVLDRARSADALPRPDRARPDGADHVGCLPARPALVEGRGHRPRGRDQARAADLPSVPAADQEVPAGGRGGGDVRRHRRAGVRRAARRLAAVVAGRRVRPQRQDRVRRLGRQPVAQRRGHPAGRKRRGRLPAVARAGRP